MRLCRGTHLVIMSILANDIHRLDDVDVLQRGADTEFGGYLFLVFLLAFTGSFRSELFDCVDGAPIFRRCFDETDGAASTGTQGPAPFAVLFSEMSVSSVMEGEDGLVV